MFPSLAFLSSFFFFFLFFFVCVSISQRSQLISMSVNVKSFKKGLQIDFFSSGGTRVLSDSTGSSGDPWYCYPSHGFSNIYFSGTSQWDLHIKAAHSYLIGKKDPKTQLLWIFIWGWCHIVGRNWSLSNIILYFSVLSIVRFQEIPVGIFICFSFLLLFTASLCYRNHLRCFGELNLNISLVY